MPTGQVDRLMPTLRRVVLARRTAARTDGELLGAFVLSADADAFAELVRRHGPMVLGVCRRVVGDHATADDAFQAAFLVLARRAAAVRPRERVGSWLYGVAYRTALKARMVLARRRSREKQVSVMPEPPAPAPLPAWTDLQPVIDEELARLPDKLRLPVVLCDLEGRPQREVAKSLGVPPATLATRLASARRTLAARLTRRGVTLSGGALAGLLGLHASASAVPHALAAGVVRAVEAGATGTLVSAGAVQLSEGVIQMMMLAKLKAVAVIAAVALALTTGVGVGLLPASAGDRLEAAPPTARSAPKQSADKVTTDRLRAQADPEADDVTFLRKLCLSARGTPPTDVETWFFTSDQDDDKRTKVVVWMTDGDADRAAIAKKLGVPVEKVQVIRGKLSADGRFVEITLDASKSGVEGEPLTDPLTFTPDGKKLIVRQIETKDGKPIAGTFNQNVLGVVRDDLLVNKVPAGTDPARTWSIVFDEKTGKEGAVRVWNAAPDQKDVLWAWVGGDDKDGKQVQKWIINEVNFDVSAGGGDAEFLKRVLTDARGNGPTALELKYFTEDKDPKKREKLLDALLKDAAVQKKLGDDWKKRMLTQTFKAKTSEIRLDGVPNTNFIPRFEVDGKKIVIPVQPDVKVQPLLPNQITPPKPPKPPTPPVPPMAIKPLLPTPPVPPTPAVKPPVPPTPAAPPADKLEKLVGDLIAAKKDDAAVLEALTLATLGRLPTDAEKKLTLAGVSTATDRKAAWTAIAKALAGSEVRKTETQPPRAVEGKPIRP